MLPVVEAKRYTTLVEARTVLLHLDDPTWVMLDCRYDLLQPQAGFLAYLSSHLPGAQYADLLGDLSAPPTGRNGRHPLPGLPALTGLFSRLGIDASRQVVAYDGDGGMYAARAWWLLRFLGHGAAAVMDGGYPAWAEQGFPVRGGRESRAGTTFLSRPRPEDWVSAEGVPDVDRLLDARAPERYRGETESIDPVAGHIPGAWSYPWGSSLNPYGYFLPMPELRAGLSRALGGMPTQRTAVYCGSGVSACHVLLAMEHAGWTGAKLYPGSWSEWCADPAHPVARGHEGPPPP
jgi:thiosulfate/3-mercaptopyruvate sulfurtransferase